MPWLHRHRRMLLALIAAFWTGLVALAHFFPTAPFLSTVWSGEQGFEDLLRRQGRKTPTRPDLVFVGIDQSSLEFQPFDETQVANNRALQLMAGHSFPWSREVWALLLDRLFNAGARLVMFDLVCSPPNEGDLLFRQALDRYRDKVVLGANFDFSEVEEVGGQVKNV